MKRIKSVSILVIVAILSLLLALTACTAEDSQPDFEGCENCHPDVAANFTTSLHYNAYGMMGEYERGAAGHFGIDMDAFYEEGSCANCHATTCTVCHVGEGGHGGEMSIEICDKCHLKKQTSTFVGDMPAHSGKGPHADVHYEKGLVCTDCHSAEELHGDGNIYAHQQQAVMTACEDCHGSPGKVVRGMNVTQYSLEISAHEIHDGTLDCAACHAGWVTTCVNCHLETRKADGIVTDEFYLAKASDGKIKPFLKMSASYGNETHTGYAEWMPHTITAEAKDCAFCHENREVLCEGCEGQMLGDGGSFIPQETIDRIIGAHITAPTPAATESATEPTPAEDTPGFAGMFAAAIIGIVYLMARKRE
ncbi:MAG: cytochrome c3 family protein [Euryarchaeota archaeon]|nr:cytochrome c3 family protein [Euryarchaeota archaeon]